MGKLENGNHGARTQQEPQVQCATVPFQPAQPQNHIQIKRKSSDPKVHCNSKHGDDGLSSPRKRRCLGQAHQVSAQFDGNQFTGCNTKAISSKDNCVPMQEKSRSKNSDAPFSLEQTAQVVESRYAQCVDCKTKNVSTTSRHENLVSNMKSEVSYVTMKWYRLLQIAVCDKGRCQLQTPCLCGKVRIFTQRRAVRKGVAITYFATNACSCGHKQTDKLLMCSCGALFRTTASLYACPCFGRLGPALGKFPNYSEFAPRPCACPPHSIKRHSCSCMS